MCIFYSVFIEECGVIVIIYLCFFFVEDYIYYLKIWLILEFYLIDVVEKIVLIFYV